MRIARIRKAITAALGMAVTLILLVPQENIPERWRPTVGVVLGLATVFGVYRVHNARPVTREDLARHVDTIGQSQPTRHVRSERPRSPRPRE
jgi:hypothetical protein